MPLTIYFSSFQFLQILFVSFICLVIEYSREKGVGMGVMYIVLSFSLSLFLIVLIIDVHIFGFMCGQKVKFVL